MPEENWAAHGGVQACDLCHARKVKCDRKEPCSHCISAKTECLRNRHKRAPRPKTRTDDKLQALVQRLTSLESSIRSSQSTTPITPSQDASAPPSLNEGPTRPERPLKRKRTSIAPSETVSASPGLDTDQQPVNEALSLISNELSSNGLLSVHQRSVLETAISFVDHLSRAPVTTITDRSTFDTTMHVPTDLSRGEILHVILGTESKKVDEATIHFHSLDHIPPRAVEKIALALMEGDADEKTLSLYKIIIHFKAAVVLYASQMEGPKSEAVQKHIMEMEYVHLSAALTALDSISFLTTPSLLLVQALITGAMMMQIVGNPVSCWELIAHASLTIVALGYHNITDTEPKSQLDEEIHAAVAWCAQFDSCMSLLLLRPRSLPPLQVKASSLIKLDPANPMSIFEIIAMELVPVHYKILDVTRELNAKRPMPLLKEAVSWLRKAMQEIHTLMEKERPTHLLNTVLDIFLHCKCLEFKYYSTLTAVHRLSPTVTTNAAEREECLQSARNALECVKVIEEVGKSLGHFLEGYDPYLAWTMLSYPLCPFFVVFCNVVGTSNMHDFALLSDVTHGISALVSQNKFVNRLHRLCASLLGLCAPLVRGVDQSEGVVAGAAIMTSPMEQPVNRRVRDTREYAPLYPPLLRPKPATSHANNASTKIHHPHSSTPNPSTRSRSTTTTNNGTKNPTAPALTPNSVSNITTEPNITDPLPPQPSEEPFLASSWNDDMMWQLFQSQPSLDWFNADILDLDFGGEEGGGGK